MSKYVLKSSTEKPLFNYLVKSLLCADYWLYNDFNKALNKAKEVCRKNKYPVKIYEPVLCTGEWMLYAPYLLFDYNEVCYDTQALPESPAKLLVTAGIWLNPNEDVRVK